jgi:DNA polymerase-3 subunit delta
MTPDAAILSASSGQLLPVYLVVGEERFLQTRVLDALAEAYGRDAIAGLNEDDFSAGECDVGRVLGAARTLPMMSRRRWVLVRDLDRWEEKGDGGKGSRSKGEGGRSEKGKPLDQVCAYAEAPSETTVLVLIATKLDARRRLLTLAKKKDFLVKCDPVAKKSLPGWVRSAAKERGRSIAAAAAELIAEVQGPELSVLDDTVERLCLFAPEGEEITIDHVTALIPVIHPSTVWELVDALGRGDGAGALASLARVYDPSDRGLRLLGTIAWSTRQLIRFQSARRAGKSPDQAASAAGAPPFRAHALEAQTRRSTVAQFERWLERLGTIDLDLKGGSKRPPRAILEAALIDLCQLAAREQQRAESRPRQ